MQKTTAYNHLQEKWTKRHEQTKKRLWEKHQGALQWLKSATKHFTVGSLGSLMLFVLPGSVNAKPLLPFPTTDQRNGVDKNIFLISDLKPLLPPEMRSLSPIEEEQVMQVIKRDIGLSVSAQIGDFRLNRSYGLIGAEQHLARFPGDTMSSHFDSDQDAVQYGASGMAPGLGAWGYFATSEASMTPKENLQEKYYIAVQTFLSVNYQEKTADYNQFFKHRKMLVINPNNGKVIITDIGDSGPAVWTGKHLGGSPEVMRYLERFDGAQRGAVLYFFLDDPNDTIPLGPVSL